MKQNVLILIPAFNESKTIGTVLEDLLKVGMQEIAVINDGSTDDTAMIVSKYPVKLISHSQNLGYGATLRTGFEYFLRSPFLYTITCDGDGQHLAIDAKKMSEYISQLPVQEKVDVVLGNRLLSAKKQKDIPLIRQLYLKIAYVTSLFYTGIPITDCQCGLRLYSKEAISKMNLKSRDMDLSLEILKEINRNRLSYKEFPVVPVYTEYSLSKGQSLSKGMETILRLVIKGL